MTPFLESRRRKMRQRGRWQKPQSQGWRRWTRRLDFSTLTGAVALLISIYNFYMASIYIRSDLRVRIIDSKVTIKENPTRSLRFIQNVSIANLGNKPGIMQTVTLLIRSKPNSTCEEAYRAYKLPGVRQEFNDGLESFSIDDVEPVSVAPGELKLARLGSEGTQDIDTFEEYEPSFIKKLNLAPRLPSAVGCIVFSTLDYRNRSKDIVFETSVYHDKDSTIFHVEDKAKIYYLDQLVLPD